MTKIIVFGNEKGGSGKSTTAMHVMAYLLQKKASGWSNRFRHSTEVHF
jgi:cellulose biosynthesis protein BcsQ